MARKVKKELTAEQRRRRTIIIIASIVGGIVLIAGIVVLVLWMKATGAAPLPEDVVQGVEASRTERQRSQARHQVQQVQNAIRNNRRQQFQMRLSNADIRQLLAEAGRIPGVQNPHVYCGSGRIVVTGTAEHGGRSWNMQAATQLQASGGGLSGSVSSLKVGSMNAPAELRQELDGRLQEALARQTPQRTGLYIQSISIQPGYAVISGHTTGR